MRKVKREAFDSISNDEIPQIPDLKVEVPIFSKIDVPSTIIPADTAISIHINGITIDIRDGASESIIKSTLQVIRNLC
jgi:hypothetical protein